MIHPEGVAVNSREWWEWYFQTHWDNYGGGNQTAHFMKRLLESLPLTVAAYLRSRPWRILDWGCAFGEGVELLARAFPASAVAGLDFSAEAIEQARQRHPGRRFLHHPEGAIDESYDVIITSNCLEHFHDPVPVMERHLASASRLYVSLTPYDEQELHWSHAVSLREDSFPERLGEWTRIEARRVEVDRMFWPGEQLLAIYASPVAIGEI
ncbi:MAG: class I SAM-dependent methyltransferase [Bryobacteraceae bacterium]